MTRRLSEPKRVECTASVYGLLVALGVAPVFLAPLAPCESGVCTLRRISATAGVDVPETT